MRPDISTLLICLPGIITPAADRYRALQEVVPGRLTVIAQELQVYSRQGPPRFELEDEIAAVLGAADRVGAQRFHFLGYSTGAAVGLALAAAHPDRLLSLVLDEPPTDWSAEDLAGEYWTTMRSALHGQDGTLAQFATLQLAEGVEPPDAADPPPPWMSERPRGIAAFVQATSRPPERASAWSALRVPVLWLGGDLSHPHYAAVRDRLAAGLPQLSSHVFPGTHHLASAGVQRPADYAEVLRGFWRASQEPGASPG